MRRQDPAHRGERGQILIMFALAIFVIVGVIGLVLDGGAAYAQRRAEQGVADLAAMAGATAFLNTPGDAATKNAAADAAARSIATQNGYTHGVNGAVGRRRASPTPRRRDRPGRPHRQAPATTSRRSSGCRPGTCP